ncbi:E3 ubiquitin-protein ligase TRIM35-like [Polymixia lowei]
MAEKNVLFESYLTCHVCSETFRDPVSLSCNHSFCSNCLQKFWEQTKNKNCPICKRKSSKDHPPVNFTLKELADSYAGRQKAETDEGAEKVAVVRSKHPEYPKHVHDIPHHRGHEVVPIEQAVSEPQDPLISDKRNKSKEVEKTYNEVVQYSKKQLVDTERKIRAEFEKLHQFLREEEEARLAALREEEEQKRKTITQEMKIIQEQISSISDISQISHCSLSDPQLVSGALIDVAKHLGNLSFRVWEKMKGMIKFTPVILDPNTANPWLSLSDDLTSVRYKDTMQQLPDIPERNIWYPTVLGSEGFSSGEHSWEVEVGDHPTWNIGLAQESVERKGDVHPLPICGIWCLLHRSGTYSNGLHETLTVERRPQRIRVQLDYDMGEVSFYDPEYMTHIYTYKDTFTEKLYPYFDIGLAGDAKTIDIKVCQAEASLETGEAEKMAEKNILFERYLNCHVCSETFRDPVSLSCHHSFCSTCLQKFWEQTENKNCPICKRKSSKEDPLVNFALKELADSYAGRQKAETDEGAEKVEVVCSKHPEDPKLFCEEEQRAVCHVCDFPHHQGHKVVPIEQAVSDLKDQLKSDLKPLQDKRNKYKEVEKTYNEVVQYSKKQLVDTERKIRAEFEKLHQFLREEEEVRLAALREEEEQKKKTITQEVKIIQEQISSLSDRISAVEQDLQKHNVLFLSSYKHTQTRARAHCSLSDPQLVSGALIDVAKHLGNLSFRVWEKMKEMIKFTPVILDPNTAAPCLSLSDDLTSVRYKDTKQQLPDIPERNTMYATVLGSEGFSSGEHSWEVEVGDHPDWNIGLAQESLERKGKRYASPEYGIWCSTHRSGKYTNVLGETLTVKRSLQRIRVQLDYDMGKVSFYDPEDMTLIYTHKDTFTEKLYPYFNIGKSGDAKTIDIKVCQAEASL